MRSLVPLTLFLSGAAPAVTVADVRALIAKQEAAWNAGNVAAWAATYAPAAIFTDQARSNENTVVPYGTSRLPQAKTQARKALAKAKVREIGQVLHVRVGADGKTAGALSYVVTRLETGGRVRLICAERAATFSLAGGGLRATSQTDTVVRCRVSRPRPGGPASAPR